MNFVNDVPALILSLRAASKIFAFTAKSPVEINGWGLVEQSEEGKHFYVSDVFILKQEVSGGDAEGDQDALMEFLGACMEPQKVKFQWHSHHEMAAWYSSTDTEGIEDYGCSADYMLSMVVNKAQDCVCRLDLFRPFRMTSEVPVFVSVPIEKAIMEFCQREFDAKVTMRAPSFSGRVVDAIDSVTGLGKEDGMQENQREEIKSLLLPLSRYSR